MSTMTLNAAQPAHMQTNSPRLRVRCPQCALKMRIRLEHAGKCVSCPRCEAKVGVHDPSKAYGVEDVRGSARSLKRSAFTTHKLALIVAADAAAFCVAGLLIARLFVA